jgi:hypothetical protein
MINARCSDAATFTVADLLLDARVAKLIHSQQGSATLHQQGSRQPRGGWRWQRRPRACGEGMGGCVGHGTRGGPQAHP